METLLQIASPGFASGNLSRLTEGQGKAHGAKTRDHNGANIIDERMIV